MAADSGDDPQKRKDTRQYQAIRLDNDMVVLLVSDPQAVKSLSALVVPVGSLQDPADHQGLAHFLEHMTLMGSQKYPQPDSLAEFLKLHGGSHNASTAPYRTAFYLEVENDALDGAVDRLADAIAAPLLDKKYADRERNAVNAELTMARTRDGMRMAQVSAETINPAHPAAHFSGGNLETLSDKPGSPVLDALHTFRDSWYSANLMKAVIYSNKPLPALARMAADTFGRVPNRQISRPEITVPVVTDAQKASLFTMCRRCRVKCCASSFASTTTAIASAAKPMSWSPILSATAARARSLTGCKTGSGGRYPRRFRSGGKRQQRRTGDLNHPHRQRPGAPR